MTLEEVRAAVDELSSEDKEILSIEFVHELEEIDSDIEKAWIAESERRLDEIESGKVECIPASEVIGRIKRRIDAKSTVSSAG